MLLEVSCEEAAQPSRFLCEASASTSVQSVLEQVVALYNARSRLAHAMLSVLGAPEQTTRGDEGPISEEERARALTAAEALLSPLSVRRKVVMRADDLERALAELRSHLNADAAANAAPSAELAMETAELVFGSRSLQREHKLADYVGRNEKTKAHVQLRFPACAAGTTAAAPTAAAPSAAAPTVPKAGTATGRGVGAVGVAGDAPTGTCVGPSEEVSLSSFFTQPGIPRSANEEAAVEPGVQQEEELLSKADEEELIRAQPIDQVGAHPRRRLLEQLRYIDGASNREAALRRLESTLVEEEFGGFCDGLLQTIGKRASEPPPL